MTDQQNRPQSLLEAAKTLASHLSLVVAWPKDRDYQNLLAAIAREEAKPVPTDGERRCWEGLVDSWRKGHDEQKARAQQAESAAAWHKAESERLSQALAEAKKSVAYLANRACDTIPVDTSGHWQQRAENAEAKVRNLQRQNRDAIDERDRLRFHTETIEYRLHCVRQALGVAP